MSASWLMSSAMTPAQEHQLDDEQRHRHQRNSASQLHEQRNHESASWQHLNAVNSGVRKLAACAIDNASNAIDYEHERKLADEQHHDTSARAPANNMPFNQRHHYIAPASYTVKNTSQLHEHAPSATPATPAAP